MRAFGAVGDGKTNDTRAIQRAIDACPPGGVVWLPKGTFLSGTIRLKSAMSLFLDSQATLLGSGAASDYPDQNPPLQNTQLHNCRKALVYAEGCTNIVITGGGTINGNGRANFRAKTLEATRPMAVWTTLCNGVSLHDFKIVDAAMWTMVNMQSDNLSISNIVIDDHDLGGNRDGCDIVDCWHVRIANLTINSGDDAICLKSGNPRGVNDLRVKNCTVIKSQSNALKFGTASVGVFTNIVFQDCTITKTSHSAMAIESVDGSVIRDVTFERIHCSTCQNAIFIVLGGRHGRDNIGGVDGITFRDIDAGYMRDTRGCPISGYTENRVTHPVKNIRLENVNIDFRGGLGSVPGDPPEYAGQYPENTMWTNLPAFGYYLRHVSGVTFVNCVTKLAARDARPWLATNDVSGLVLVNNKAAD